MSTRSRTFFACAAALMLVAAGCSDSGDSSEDDDPTAEETSDSSSDAERPFPEAVEVRALPLPPTAPSPDEGSCDSSANPNGTGCLDATRAGVDGARTFSPDGNHVYASVTFAGAPAAPDPASAYDGAQLIVVKTDGTTFANGDGWKCVTCGVPDENQVGLRVSAGNTYPEAFRDGTRVKTGGNILDCGDHQIVDDDCTPEETHIYPIKSPFPDYPEGGLMREMRLHPDEVHLGWNQLFFAQDNTAATEFGAFGRLEFNPTPDEGPPGYEVLDVSYMLSPELGGSGRFFRVDDNGDLEFTQPTGVIGEFRGFTPDGTHTLGMGTQDSFNYDIFATSLETGESTRLSHDPAYTDPVTASPDGNSLVILDGRVTADTGYPDALPAGEEGRMYFASAGPGVPPLIDMAIAEAVGSLYTDPARGSFLQPFILDYGESHDGDDIHDGQQLNAGGDPTAGSGSISDPLWLAGADPAWSPDGTAVVFYQRRGCNEGTTCPPSTEPGGRESRLMIAELTDREPTEPLPKPEPVPDLIPWGIPYEAGDAVPPERQIVPAGTYTLNGQEGSAEVVITHGPSRFNPGSDEVLSVEVTYDNYSADGVNFVDGTEAGIRGSNPTTLTWHSDLVFSGAHEGTRTTSEPGGFRVVAGELGGKSAFEGSLVTVLDGKTYTSPTS